MTDRQGAKSGFFSFSRKAESSRGSRTGRLDAVARALLVAAAFAGVLVAEPFAADVLQFP
jgi:hypothetical protein